MEEGINADAHTREAATTTNARMLCLLRSSIGAHEQRLSSVEDKRLPRRRGNQLLKHWNEDTSFSLCVCLAGKREMMDGGAAALILISVGLECAAWRQTDVNTSFQRTTLHFTHFKASFF